MSVPPPKNARTNLAYKRLIHYCQQNKIMITNLSTINLSPIEILIGPCITNGCPNNFEKTYSQLLTSNGYCMTCNTEKSIKKNHNKSKYNKNGNNIKTI
jgi:hypothetical protein